MMRNIKQSNLASFFILHLICYLFGIIANTYAQGAYNCLNFDGFDDHVIVLSTSGDELNPANSITIECWLNANINFTSEHRPRLIVKDQSYGMFVEPGGSVRFLIFESSLVYGNISLQSGIWYHIAGTYDGSQMKLYINGIAQDSTNRSTPIPPSSNSVQIGTFFANVVYHLNGLLDEIRIWRSARSATQIREFMNKKLTPNDTSGLVGYWRLDESTGNLAPDLSPYSNNGTLMNMTDEDWITSTAPIGDGSVYTLNSSNLNLASSDGDNISINNIYGNPSFISLIRVDEGPNYKGVGTGLQIVDPLRYWEVWIFGGSSPTYDLIYNYDGHPGISDEDDLRLGYRADATVTSWLDAGSLPNNINKTLSLSSQSAGRQYILASSSVDNSLPVDLISSSVTFTSQGVRISWRTASEINNLGFEIRKKVDSDLDYNVISSYLYNNDLKGLGSSTIGKYYEFIDTDVYPNETYCYEIVSVDFDGSVHIYDPLSITTNENDGLISETFNISDNYPNPFNPSTNFLIMTKQSIDIILEIYSVNGQLVDKKEYHNLPAGNSAIKWTAKDIPSGTYFYKIYPKNLKDNPKTGRMLFLK